MWMYLTAIGFGESWLFREARDVPHKDENGLIPVFRPDRGSPAQCWTVPCGSVSGKRLSSSGNARSASNCPDRTSCLFTVSIYEAWGNLDSLSDNQSLPRWLSRSESFHRLAASRVSGWSYAQSAARISASSSARACFRASSFTASSSSGFSSFASGVVKYRADRFESSTCT